jgi:hypothetical protein
MLGAQMVAEARIAAHFVDAAEKAGFTTEEINRHFRQLAETTVINEFWVTDVGARPSQEQRLRFHL